MSNLTTLPKGDSAWLLRKAIERLMQQVSVLETNIGSSTTGNSADTQIIFNDNGTLRGDTGLVYNKSTDLLSFGAGLCYGALSITGDLTVATNSLKVTGGNVGIGTATPTNYANYTTLTINGTNGGEIDLTDGGTLRGQLFSESTGLTLAAVGGLIKFGAGTGGTEKMRLDSSGNLGLGVTPSAWGSNSKALQVGGGSASVSSTGAGSTASRFAHGAYFDNTNWLYQYPGVGPALYQVTGANAGSTHAWYIAPGGPAGTAIAWTQAMTLDASGNLCVGVTSATYKLEVSGIVRSGADAGIGGLIINSASASGNQISWQSAGTNKFAIGRNVGAGGATDFSLYNYNATKTSLTVDKDSNFIIGDSAIATSATDGFVYIPTCAGTPTGTPTSYTGRVAMVVDSTNSKFYVYVGGSWKSATLA